MILLKFKTGFIFPIYPIYYITSHPQNKLGLSALKGHSNVFKIKNNILEDTTIQFHSNHTETFYSLPDYIKQKQLDYVLISTIIYPTETIQNSLNL